MKRNNKTRGKKHVRATSTKISNKAKQLASKKKEKEEDVMDVDSTNIADSCDEPKLDLEPVTGASLHSVGVLPDDILYEIIKYLPLDDLLTVLKTLPETYAPFVLSAIAMQQHNLLLTGTGEIEINGTNVSDWTVRLVQTQATVVTMQISFELTSEWMSRFERLQSLQLELMIPNVAPIVTCLQSLNLQLRRLHINSLLITSTLCENEKIFDELSYYLSRYPALKRFEYIGPMHFGEDSSPLPFAELSIHMRQLTHLQWEEATCIVQDLPHPTSDDIRTLNTLMPQLRHLEMQFVGDTFIEWLSSNTSDGAALWSARLNLYCTGLLPAAPASWRGLRQLRSLHVFLQPPRRGEAKVVGMFAICVSTWLSVLPALRLLHVIRGSRTDLSGKDFTNGFNELVELHLNQVCMDKHLAVLGKADSMPALKKLDIEIDDDSGVLKKTCQTHVNELLRTLFTVNRVEVLSVCVSRFSYRLEARTLKAAESYLELRDLCLTMGLKAKDVWGLLGALRSSHIFAYCDYCPDRDVYNKRDTLMEDFPNITKWRVRYEYV